MSPGVLEILGVCLQVVEGLAQWLNGYNPTFRHWAPMWVLDHVLPMALPTQLHACG